MPVTRKHVPPLENLLSGYGPSWLQLLREPLENLRLLGRRAFLALLGIAVGCMSVVALLNIGHNARLQAMSIFKGMGSDILLANVQLSDGMERGTVPSTTTLDTRELNKVLPGIMAATPLISLNLGVRLNGRPLKAITLGSDASLSEVLDLRLAKGRFLSRFDTNNAWVVSGASVGEEWKNAGLRIAPGEHIQIGSYLFEVIGVLQHKENNPMLPFSPDESIFLPAESMKRIMPNPQITSVVVRTTNSDVVEQTIPGLRSWLEKKMPGYEVNVQAPQQLLDGIEQQSRLFSWLLGGLGGIALLVGGIGVMNVMVMNVAERRREIGVRMALGARPKDIALLFLLESIVLSASGSVVGAVSGLGIAWIFVFYSGWTTFSLSVAAFPLGIGSAVAIGLFFGLSPAMAAARLSPVQALRDE